MKRILFLGVLMIIVSAVYSSTPLPKFKGTGDSAIVNKTADSVGIIQGGDTLRLDGIQIQ